jgi:hypothetical protein
MIALHAHLLKAHIGVAAIVQQCGGHNGHGGINSVHDIPFVGLAYIILFVFFEGVLNIPR